jgi:uncharacterized membrane protein YkgB
MIELSAYEKCLTTAYLVGIIIQVISLYILSIVFSEQIQFQQNFVIMYIIFATLQFLFFRKIISEKK